MKCLINIFVVLFIFNYLEISNGYKWKGTTEVVKESSDDVQKVDYKELFNTIPEEGL